jgi:uncharacterized membrane protein YhaH (DUF805 family)
VLSFQPQKRRSPVLWLLFSLAGRISRSIYWLGYLFIVSVQSIVLAQMVSGGAASFYQEAVAVGPVILLATVYWNIAIAVKRLHDVGYGGFLALAALIPLVNLAFTLWVGFLPGTAGPNRFGDVADVPPP